MKVDLDKTGMIDLVCGTNPDRGSDLEEALENKKLGYVFSGECKCWQWDRDELKKLDNPQLLALYKQLRY